GAESSWDSHRVHICCDQRARGYKMLFDSEHPARVGRRRSRAPQAAAKRLPVLMLDRRVATKLWHTGCVAALRNSATKGGGRVGARRRTRTGEDQTSMSVIKPRHQCREPFYRASMLTE